MIYKSLEELYIDNYLLIYTYISDYTTRQEDADELSAIIWAKVAENPERYLSMNKVWLKNYLRIMTRTTAADYFEKVAQYKGHLSEDSIDILADTIQAHSTEEEFFRREDLRHLKTAKMKLTSEENEILAMRYETELSARDVGEAFGITEGSLRVRQHRILKKLKAEITRLRNGGK